MDIALTTAQIKYLLVIYRLWKTGIIHLSDIAERLQKTKPTVYKMLRQWEALGIIERQKYATVTMTESGLKLAKKYYTIYIKMETYFSQFMDRKTASQATVSFLGSCGIDSCEHFYKNITATQ